MCGYARQNNPTPQVTTDQPLRARTVHSETNYNIGELVLTPGTTSISIERDAVTATRTMKARISTHAEMLFFLCAAANIPKFASATWNRRIDHDEAKTNIHVVENEIVNGCPHIPMRLTKCRIKGKCRRVASSAL